MKRTYIKSIIWLIVSIILSLIIYVATSYLKWNIVSTIFGNMSVGLITGFVILIITNLKISSVYQIDCKIKCVRKIIDNSRDYEIKILNFKSMTEISVIEMINIYADIANLFTDIRDYDSDLYNNNSLNCENIVQSCNEMIGKLSDFMSDVTITNKKYDKEFDWDLSSKMVKIFKLRRDLQTDLKRMEKEIDELNKSII